MPTTLKGPAGPIYRKDPGITLWRQEAASQTFKNDDFVIIDSSEQLAIAAASGNNVGSVLIAGRAKADASGTQGTMIPFDKGNDCEHLLPMYHATPASAVTSEDHVGKFTTLRNEGGVWCVVVSAYNATYSAALQMQCVEVALDYPVGTQYGFEWLRIAPDSRLFN